MLTPSRKFDPDRGSVALILAAQGGDVGAQNRLVLANWGLIVTTGGRVCRGAGRGLEEWLSIGVEAFIDAVHRFRPELGCRLSTYAVSVMTQRYVDAWEERTIVRVPRFRGEVTQKRIDAARRAWRMHSLDKVVDIKGHTLHDEVATRLVAESDDERMEKGERLAALGAAMQGLTFRSREVLLLRARGRTLRQVGAEVGLSVERVRQVEMEAMKELRELMKVAE